MWIAFLVLNVAQTTAYSRYCFETHIVDSQCVDGTGISQNDETDNRHPMLALLDEKYLQTLNVR